MTGTVVEADVIVLDPMLRRPRAGRAGSGTRSGVRWFGPEGLPLSGTVRVVGYRIGAAS